MTKQDILNYELANSPAEHVSNEFLQNIIARYYAWKVNRKWKNYEKMLARVEYLKKEKII